MHYSVDEEEGWTKDRPMFMLIPGVSIMENDKKKTNRPALDCQPAQTRLQSTLARFLFSPVYSPQYGALHALTWRYLQAWPVGEVHGPVHVLGSVGAAGRAVRKQNRPIK